MKNNSNKKISIITPCYNSEKTIADTLESVLNQNYDNYEYIIQDAKSTDKTLEIIKSYEKKFKGKLFIYSEKDSGIFDAMNKGIKHSTGDIIGIINSDDVLANNNVFKTIAEKFTKENIDIVFSDLMFYNDNLTKIVRTFITKEGNVKKGWHPPHPTLYVSKKVYEQEGIFNTNFKIAADLDFMIRIFKDNKYNYEYVKDVFVKMRAGGVSTAGFKGYKKNFQEAILVYKSNGIKYSTFINVKRTFKTIFQIIKSKFTK